MGQLMDEQLAPTLGLRLVPPSAKDNIRPSRVRLGVDGLRGLGGASVGVDAHMAKVVAKVRLHRTAGAAVERLAW
jgi:hypothetical protein